MQGVCPVEMAQGLCPSLGLCVGWGLGVVSLGLHSTTAVLRAGMAANEKICDTCCRVDVHVTDYCM